jgi:hypothetical protein
VAALTLLAVNFDVVYRTQLDRRSIWTGYAVNLEEHRSLWTHID